MTAPGLLGQLICVGGQFFLHSSNPDKGCFFYIRIKKGENEGGKCHTHHVPQTYCRLQFLITLYSLHMSNYHLRSTVLVLHLYLLTRNYHRECLGTLDSNLVMVSLMCNVHRQCVTLYKYKQRVYNIMTGVAVIKIINQCLIFFLHLHVVHTQLTNCTCYLAFQF